MQQTEIYQSTAGAVLIFDESGYIVLSNSYVNQVFGYDEDELVGKQIDNIVLSRLEGKKDVSGGGQPSGPGDSSRLRLKGLKKRGEEFPIEISLAQFTGGKEVFTAAYIFEIIEDTNPRDWNGLGEIIFLILDETGRILSINEYGCELLGSEPGTLIGTNYFDKFLPRERRQPDQSQYEKILRLGLLENYESLLQSQKGQQRTILWTSAVIYDSRRQPVATLSTGVDTGKTTDQEESPYVERIKKLNEHLRLSVKEQTQELAKTLAKVENINRDLQLQIHKRKAIEEKLITIQRTYDTMVHNFPDGVIGILNREMRYVLIDGMDLNEIDLPAMGLTGRQSIENHDPLVAEETLTNLRRAFDGETVSFEIAANDRVYNVNVVPLYDGQQNINEILCVLKNVTERKRMEDGLRKALEKEKELGELKSRFVTMASHEFRTPLTTILSSTFLLENYNGEDLDQEKFIHTNRIKRAVNNLTMILNEFLSLEKFEDNKVPLLVSDIDIPSFIRNVIFEIESVKKDGQAIEYHHDSDQTMFRIDHKILWSILTNLISNALKYSKENSTIQVRTEVTGNEIKFQVKDTGIGIPEEEQRHIFERFFRARNATNLDGTGLGLHIVQKYVHLLKGTIAFDSQLDVGTTFTVVLPKT